MRGIPETQDYLTLLRHAQFAAGMPWRRGQPGPFRESLGALQDRPARWVAGR
jgi:hypothetical protein